MKSLLFSLLVFKLALSLGVSFQDFFHLITPMDGHLKKRFQISLSVTSFEISLCSMNSTQVVRLFLIRIVF